MATVTLTIYAASLAIGVIYVVIGAILGEIAHHGLDAVGGHDFDVGGADVGHDIGVGHDVGDVHGVDLAHDVGVGSEHISPFKPLTIATFFVGFGAVGLLTQLGIGLSPWASLFVAGPGALAIAALEFAAFVKLVIRAQASSEATYYDTLGAEAEVSVAIPEGGLGQVAYHVKGFRYQAPARSEDVSAIAMGDRVRIVHCEGNVYTVRRL